jgi:hypothetical protein
MLEKKEAMYLTYARIDATTDGFHAEADALLCSLLSKQTSNIFAV